MFVERLDRRMQVNCGCAAPEGCNDEKTSGFSISLSCALTALSKEEYKKNDQVKSSSLGVKQM